MNCIKALLSHPGIDVNIKNNEGRTAMMVHAFDGAHVHVSAILEYALMSVFQSRGCDAKHIQYIILPAQIHVSALLLFRALNMQ